MLQTARIFTLSFALSLLAFAVPAWALDYDLGMDLGGSYNSHDNYLGDDGLRRVDRLHFTDDRSYFLIQADPHLSFTLRKGISGYIQGDVYWESTDEEENDEQAGADLTNAYLSLSKGKMTADLGLQTILLGNGLIMADDVPAAVLNLDADKGYMQLTLAQVLDSSPMMAAKIGVHPGFLEEAAIFGAWFQDQDDAFARAIPVIYRVLLEPQSEGDLYWAGVSANLFWGKILFSAVGAYQWGQFRLYNDSQDLRRDVSGYFADLSLEGNLTPWCSLGAFVFVASGDDTPLRGDLDAIVSIRPFNPRATIFFDPEFLGRDETDEELTFNGGFFGGVIAPGLTLSLESESGFSLDLTASTLYAQQSLDDGSQWYGWEIDLGLNYAFSSTYTLYAYAARFQHGDYYESLLQEKVDPALRFSIGLKASF